MTRPARTRREAGIVLVAVLIFVLLLTSAVATFLKRATMDAMVARHRDEAAEAEALARGGVRLGITLLLEDRLQEESTGFRSESLIDVWARAGESVVPSPEGTGLLLRIRDAGARLNLNALLEEGELRDNAELYLPVLLERVIEDMPGRPEDKRYEVDALARNLLDWIDSDEVGQRGGRENDYYARQEPAYEAANRPLLSVDELRLVEGFDGALVDALRHYVGVHPYVLADGVNPNTAPPHVLGILYHGVGQDFRLAEEDTVRRVLDAREEGELLCADEAQNPACSPLSEIVEGEVFPPPTFQSDVFFVEAEARIGSVRRTVEAVVDRSTPDEPLLLSWRVQ